MTPFNCINSDRVPIEPPEESRWVWVKNVADVYCSRKSFQIKSAKRGHSYHFLLAEVWLAIRCGIDSRECPSSRASLAAPCSGFHDLRSSTFHSRDPTKRFFRSLACRQTFFCLAACACVREVCGCRDRFLDHTRFRLLFLAMEEQSYGGPNGHKMVCFQCLPFGTLNWPLRLILASLSGYECIWWLDLCRRRKCSTQRGNIQPLSYFVA